MCEPTSRSPPSTGSISIMGANCASGSSAELDAAISDTVSGGVPGMAASAAQEAGITGRLRPALRLDLSAVALKDAGCSESLRARISSAAGDTTEPMIDGKALVRSAGTGSCDPTPRRTKWGDYSLGRRPCATPVSPTAALLAPIDRARSQTAETMDAFCRAERLEDGISSVTVSSDACAKHAVGT